MAQKLDVGMPQDLDLVGGWTVRVTAVDATGATVTAVNVSNMAIVADSPTSSDGTALQVGPFMLVPGPGDTTGSGTTSVVVSATQSGTTAGPAPQPATPEPMTTGSYDSFVSALQPPQFNYSKHVPITTLNAYLAAIKNPQAGYWYDVQGVTVHGTVTATHALSSWCKFTYDAACKFTGSSVGSAPVPILEVRGAAFTQHIAAPGVLFTNPGGNGIHSQGGTNHCVFDGFKATDMGADGYDFFGGPYGDTHDNFIRVEAENVATQSLKFDPHSEKGTGLHGMNVQDSNKSSFRNNTVAIYCHDCVKYGGSVLECGVESGGTQPHGNSYYVKGYRMLMNALHQGAGNGVNQWGGAAHDNTFVVVEVDEMAGYAMNMGAQTGTLTNVRVAQGTATNTNQNPRFAGKNPWMKGHGLVYSPGPFTPSP